MNFASKSVIHENSLGSFTCCKAGTWNIFFYFPSEGRHTEDFSGRPKNPTASAGFEPANSGSVASMLTTRPPKPSEDGKEGNEESNRRFSQTYEYTFRYTQELHTVTNAA